MVNSFVDNRDGTYQLPPCDFCKRRPFNTDDTEYGGTCDRPDGRAGWACSGCFRRRYRPTSEWAIPNWAIHLVRKCTPEESLSRLRDKIFSIFVHPYAGGFINSQNELKYLRAELEYRTEAISAFRMVPLVPAYEQLKRALFPLKALLMARYERYDRGPEMHEHGVRHLYRTTAHNYPWEALSIGRALLDVCNDLWETHSNGSATAMFGEWKLAVRPVESQWAWQAELLDQHGYQGACFDGISHDIVSAKQRAEYKARHTLLG